MAMSQRVKYSYLNDTSLNNTTCSKKILLNSILLGSDLIQASKKDILPADKLSSQGTLKSSSTTRLLIVDTSDDEESKHKLRLLSRVYMNSTIESNITITMSIFFSCLATFFKFVLADDFNNILKGAGYKVEKVQYDIFIMELENLDMDFSETVDELYNELKGNSLDGCTLPCVGMLLLMTAKTITSANNDGWDKRRMRSFLESLGGILNEKLTQLIVNSDRAKMINQICSVIIETRSRILVEILASFDIKTIEGKLLNIVKTNIRWYQMSNFWLVTDIIVRTHPYLMIWGEIASKFYDYEQALMMYKEKGKAFPFIKYNDASISMEVFNSVSIQYLAEVAKHVAINEGQASYANYVTGYASPIPIAKIDLIIAVAKCSSFAWADYIKERILRKTPENEPFYKTIYTKSQNDVDDEITLETNAD